MKVYYKVEKVEKVCLTPCPNGHTDEDYKDGKEPVLVGSVFCFDCPYHIEDYSDYISCRYERKSSYGTTKAI